MLVALAPWCDALVWPHTKREVTTAKSLDLDIHCIKSPRLCIWYLLDDHELTIDDPDLYKDHCKELSGSNYPGDVYYLATLRGETTIIGMLEVTPRWTFDDDLVRLELVQGLSIDDIHTAKGYKRKGVATALFEAVERDAAKLYAQMELVNADHAFEKLPGGEVDLHLGSVGTKCALGFYQSTGFRLAEREGKNSQKTTRRDYWKLLLYAQWTRLTKGYTPIFDMVKRVTSKLQ